MKLKPGVVVLTNTMDCCDLKFALVDKLFVKDGEVLLGLKQLCVLNYATHYHSYVVEYSNDMCVMPMKSLSTQQVLTPRPVQGSYYKQFFVTLKYGI